MQKWDKPTRINLWSFKSKRMNLRLEFLGLPARTTIVLAPLFA